MPSPQGIAYAAFDFFLIAVILLRINTLPDIVNYLIAIVLTLSAVYELAT